MECGIINGIPLLGSESFVIQTQRRRHKKRRINKKWLKRYGYITKPDPSIYIFTDPYTRNSKQLLGHPDTLNRVVKLLEAKKETT